MKLKNGLAIGEDVLNGIASDTQQQTYPRASFADPERKMLFSAV